MTDFSKTRAGFYIPEGMIYLDGNSLGPLPIAAKQAAARALEQEWGEMLITAWNRAGWIDLPRKLGDRIAPLIGAEPKTVQVGDTLSLKLYQALGAALAMTDRKVILSDQGNFPSDLYMAQGLIQTMDQGHVLRTVAPEAVEAALDDRVGVLMLTEVDYRTGRRHDMARLTERARDLGIITIWDLAHSAGAFPVHLAQTGADFAVGCSYKYLNGGPGAPAFIYVAPQHRDHAHTVLNGWLGHATPFAFPLEYTPATGVDRMRIGTPAVVQMQILDAALDIWNGVNLEDLRSASVALSERLIAGIEASCPDLRLASPRDATMRGSQVSFHFGEAYALCQALIARGIIGDFRAPDILRFGIAPLYIGEAEIDAAIAAIAQITQDRLWDRPEWKTRNAVT
ncbi:kynureninase [Rhodobacteraceae bacterium XHP0102]|nr:kynureninase [Rhodobacteraceae bacterium XHP0102]